MYLHAEKVPPQLRLTFFYIVQLIIDGGGKANQKDVELSDKYTQVKTLFNVSNGEWTVDWYVKPKAKRDNVWKPPVFVDVEDYLSELGQANEASQFFNFYESKGWMIGKNKMKDWKAACRTWVNRNNKEQKLKTKSDDKLTSRIKRTEAEQFATEFKVK